MGLAIRFLKPCICEGRCGNMVFHELFTQGETVPDPGWPSGCVVSEIEDGPFAAISASHTPRCRSTSSRASRPKR